MTDANAVLCVSVPMLAAIGAIYWLLYDVNEIRRHAARLRRWRKS